LEEGTTLVNQPRVHLRKILGFLLLVPIPILADVCLGGRNGYRSSSYLSKSSLKAEVEIDGHG
jgi:hypothetical protein